jgi:hypothetical protein
MRRRDFLKVATSSATGWPLAARAQQRGQVPQVALLMIIPGREGRQPRPLRRIPDGRGRHPSANIPGGFTAHCETTAAATTSASMRPSMACKSNRREQYLQMPTKIARSAARPPFGLPEML